MADRGVEYLFGNAGTDFAPLIEAYAQAAQTGNSVPRPILATHENLAVSMAHGYAMLSRRIPVVMVHVSVGTANMVCAAINAARENVAILLTAGRSPITETGLPGSRDGYIHWAQEMYDQAGMIREIVKWDYELRNPQQLVTVVDRALAIAASEPRGPYTSLPREVIAAPPADRDPRPSRLTPAAAAAPDAAAIMDAARILSRAKHPLIITANAGRDTAAFEGLAQFAQKTAIPVVQHRPRYFSLPSSHPINLGFDPTRLLQQADAIMVIECDVPWIPSRTTPQAGCKVVHCGLDPLFIGIPIRGFPCDVAIPAAPRQLLACSRRRFRISSMRLCSPDAGVGSRTSARQSQTPARQRTLPPPCTRIPLDPMWVSHCIGAAKEESCIVINEYTLSPEYCAFESPDLYFGSSSASGLGWGAGAALGARLARPDKAVMAVLGDGAYMFSNPAAVHHAAALHALPVLFVVMNNGTWGAVERSTRSMYPGGLAARSNDPPFVALEKLPAFETICEAAGGYGERVEDPALLPAALERAWGVIRNEKRQALLNVICGPGGTA